MSLESSSAVLKDEKHAGIAVSTREVDTGAQLVAGLTSTLDPAEALRVRCVMKITYTLTWFKRPWFRRKIDRHIMPLMCSEYSCVHLFNSIS